MIQRPSICRSLGFPRVAFLHAPSLTDDALYAATGVRIAFTQRTGGVSEPPFDSFNLGGHVGDDPACVSRNRDILLEGIGAPDAVRDSAESGARR